MTEQLDKRESPGTKRALKKETTRKERRRGKRQLDDAPKRRRFTGYSG